jgi:hypothetical protein
MAAAALGLRKMAVNQNAITLSSLQHSATGGVGGDLFDTFNLTRVTRSHFGPFEINRRNDP